MREYPMGNDVMMEPIDKPAAAEENVTDESPVMTDDGGTEPMDAGKGTVNGG